MKKILVFEHTQYNGLLEKEFFNFCVKHQFTLLKYIVVYFLYSCTYFFRIISKKKYYEKRWSFLKDVKMIEGKIDSFWKSRKKKFTNFVSEGEIMWISEYPEILLSNLAKLYQVELVANAYNTNISKVFNFKDSYQLYLEINSDADKLCIYDNYNSKLKKIENAEFFIVYKHKFFKSVFSFLKYKTAYFLYSYLSLLIMGICIGLISMYFGAAYYLKPMFNSYFKVHYLPVLNIFPVVFCIFLIYFISNRIWFSFLATSVITMLLTWINYFKLIFRNDPLLLSDLSLFFESMQISHKYNIQLNWKIITVVIACILSTVFAIFFLRGQIYSKRVRLSGILMLLIIGMYSFQNVYTDNKLYQTTKNESLINKWSGTQVYISKGFLYPFIYSAKLNSAAPPIGYKEKAAKNKLYSYEYSDIPTKKKINVISIMMEAYNDFSKFDQLKFNVDVYKYLHQLKDESYSGELVTNIFAGGTISTERSFLTGYTVLDDFRNNVNSYARYFGEQGYTVEGSHPSYAWFYNRGNVNEYLGFENYYFFENYYSKITNNKIAPDNILFPQIIRLYQNNKKTGKPYFSFNVTYQNHGPYSFEKLTNVQYVKNQGYTDKEYNIMNNYFSGIYDTTQELKTLIDYFRQEDEPVIVILFGDHNPWMGDNNSVYNMLGINFDLGTEQGFYNYYDTPYVIWGNDSAKKTLNTNLKGAGPKIGPYFLMNEFFNLVGFNGNEFMKISNELKSEVDVVHVQGRYKDSGVLTSKLTPKPKQKIDDFLKVQYYWKNNFKK
jgi:phosphoglycerol transferase MdoB-like AlkP superfamily enzyme